MSASAQRHAPDDPVRMAAEGTRLPDWPQEFLEACKEYRIDIRNTEQRMKLWALWKEGRALA